MNILNTRTEHFGVLSGVFSIDPPSDYEMFSCGFPYASLRFCARNQILCASRRSGINI